jgi:hypothetical protein
MKARSVTIDGKALVLGPDGSSRFEELSRREAASLSVNFLIIGLSLSVLRLAKNGRDDTAQSYFRRTVFLRAASLLAPNRFKDFWREWTNMSPPPKGDTPPRSVGFQPRPHRTPQ